MHSTELTGCKGMYTECAGSSQQSSFVQIDFQTETVMLASLPFMFCTDTVESVSVSSRSLGNAAETKPSF
jgi:hypothetical protein